MFRKLRIKFIAIVMISVAIVLAAAFIGICVTQYQRDMAVVHTALNSSVDEAVAVKENGDLGGPKGPWSSEGTFVEGDPNFQGESDAASGNSTEGDQFGGMQPPSIGGRGEDHMRSAVPVAVYTVTDNEEATVLPEVTSASISSDLLSEASDIVLAATDGEGILDDLGLHYYRRTVDSTVYMAFADTTNTSNWKTLAVTLTVAGLGTLAIFFVISLFLSRWALRPVREAWDSQRQFVADASHDLKTPLTVILANTSILLKHADDSIASQSQWIESTQTEANQMQGLVAEMLELAQVEERAQLATDTVDLSDMIDAETLQFESLAFEQGCSFECAIEEGIEVTGDANRLRKMVSTLIENALKYVNDSGTVSITLERTGKSARFTVRNTGSTISADDLPHIFDRFYRTDKARTSGAGGFGLGLAIARETARAHQGDITCTSSADAGTAFIVTLPATR